MVNVIPRKVGVWLKKVGLPTGTLYLELYEAPPDVHTRGNVKVTYGTIDVSTLTESYPDINNPYVFTNDLASVLIPSGMQNGYRLGVRYEGAGSNSDNHVCIGVNYNNPFDSTYTGMSQS
jgi:hypothetical protein